MIPVGEVLKEGISEVIVTTVSPDGIPNAAPMGIVRKGDTYIIRMYSDTTTFRNVSATGYLAANFISDPRIYVISAFQDLPPEYFQFDEKAVAPRLKGAAGWAYFKCKVGDVVNLEPVSVKVEKCTLPVFSRAFSAIVEATIIGTRLRFYKGDEGVRKIREHEAIVKKCGSPADIEAMKKLKEILHIF